MKAGCLLFRRCSAGGLRAGTQVQSLTAQCPAQLAHPHGQLCSLRTVDGKLLANGKGGPTRLRSIFPGLLNKDLCYFTSKMSPLFCTLTTHIYHFSMCLCSVFYFPRHLESSHLTDLTLSQETNIL